MVTLFTSRNKVEALALPRLTLVLFSLHGTSPKRPQLVLLKTQVFVTIVLKLWQDTSSSKEFKEVN